jgi:hypothetical protein
LDLLDLAARLTICSKLTVCTSLLLCSAGWLDGVHQAFLSQPYAASVMLEAAVRFGRDAHNPAAAGAAAAAMQAHRARIGRTLSACAAPLQFGPYTQSCLPKEIVHEEGFELELFSVPAGTFALPEAAAKAAAIWAAMQGVLAAGRQQRQQLRLRLSSMVGSCVKVMSCQWQQLSWQWVAAQCSLATQLSYAIWKLEDDVARARTAHIKATSAMIKLR